MFFVLSKVAGFFAAPSNFFMVLGFVGLAISVTRFARLGFGLAVASLAMLGLMGLTPLGNALILPLEERFPRWEDSRGAPHGIIVLGGAFDTVVSRARREISLNEAGERMTAGVALARKYPAARLAFSGGSGRLIFADMSEAEVAARFFEEHGIARERLQLEGEARNTVENAHLTWRLVQPKAGERWLLVTSAYHMPRAVGVFRAAGFAVEAHPVDWRTRGAADTLRPFNTVGDGLRRTDTAVREWVGLLIYWLAGHMHELFPAPP